MMSARLITASLDDAFSLSRLPAKMLAASENMHPARRQQWRAGRALLAQAMSAFAGCEILPALQISPQGKPSFVNASLPHFSLSHSMNNLQLLLCGAGEVGCDVEQMRPRPRYLAVAREAFSDVEYQWLLEQPLPQKAFWQLWCLREAWLKQQSGSVWQMSRISLDPAGGRFIPQQHTDSQLWVAADHFVMTALALPEKVSEPEEWVYEAVTGEFIRQSSRSWMRYTVASNR